MVGLPVSDHPAAWSYVNEASPEGDAFQRSTCMVGSDHAATMQASAKDKKCFVATIQAAT